MGEAELATGRPGKAGKTGEVATVAKQPEEEGGPGFRRNGGVSASCKRFARGERNGGAKEDRGGKMNRRASTNYRRSGRGENGGASANDSFVVVLIWLLANFRSGRYLLQAFHLFLQLPVFFSKILFIIILVVVCSHSLLDFTIMTPICTGTPFTKSPLRAILGVKRTNFQESSWHNVHANGYENWDGHLEDVSSIFLL